MPDRTHWQVRKASSWDEHARQDREFWARMTPEQRVETVWRLVLEHHAARLGPDAPEPRLQRSAGRVERRGR